MAGLISFKQDKTEKVFLYVNETTGCYPDKSALKIANLKYKNALKHVKGVKVVGPEVLTTWQT